MLDTLENFLHTALQEYFFIMVYIIVLLERVKQFASRNLLLAWLINLSGTILHELSHFIVALITLAKPASFSLIPKSSEVIENGVKVKTYQLGSVSIKNANNFNRFPVGMSPLLLLVALFYIDQYFFVYFENTLLNTLLYLCVVIILLDSSIPSSQDFRQAFKGYGYVLWIGAILFIFYALNEPDFLNSITERFFK